MNQIVARCNVCGANLSLDDMRGQNCPYCQSVLPHHARAAEQAALVNQLLAQRGVGAQVPYQFGGAPPAGVHFGGPQVIIGMGAGSLPTPNAGAFPPTPHSELERIAQEAQQRQVEFAAKAAALAREGAAEHLAVALGGHYGSPVSVLCTALLVVGFLAAAAGIVLPIMGLLDREFGQSLAVGATVGFSVLLVVRLRLTPRASKGRLRAEEQWQKSLPFALTGYIEALSSEPRATCRLQFHIDWASAHFSPGPLLGRVQLVDPGSSAAPGDPSGWVSSPLAAGGSMLAPDNRKLVAYVHDLLNRALLPLHRECPIRAVAIRRDW